MLYCSCAEEIKNVTLDLCIRNGQNNKSHFLNTVSELQLKKSSLYRLTMML